MSPREKMTARTCDPHRSGLGYAFAKRRVLRAADGRSFIDDGALPPSSDRRVSSSPFLTNPFPGLDDRLGVLAGVLLRDGVPPERTWSTPTASGTTLRSYAAHG